MASARRNKRYMIGNAQWIGLREVQSNYFSTSVTNTGDLIAAVADGSVDHPNGRKSAVIAVEHCVDKLMRAEFPRDGGLPETSRFLLEIAMEANKRVRDFVYLGVTPRLSLTLVYFTGKAAHFFDVGTNKFFLYNGRNEQLLNQPAATPYRAGRHDIKRGDVFGIFTPGAYATTQPAERMRIVGKASKGNVFDKAQAIIEAVKASNFLNQLNATVLLMEAKI